MQFILSNNVLESHCTSPCFFFRVFILPVWQLSMQYKNKPLLKEPKRGLDYRCPGRNRSFWSCDWGSYFPTGLYPWHPCYQLPVSYRGRTNAVQSLCPKLLLAHFTFCKKDGSDKANKGFWDDFQDSQCLNISLHKTEWKCNIFEKNSSYGKIGSLNIVWKHLHITFSNASEIEIENVFIASVNTFSRNS